MEMSDEFIWNFIEMVLYYDICLFKHLHHSKLVTVQNDKYMMQITFRGEWWVNAADANDLQSLIILKN